jgi:hypothetical protein
MAAEKVRHCKEDMGFFRKPALPEEISRTIR